MSHPERERIARQQSGRSHEHQRKGLHRAREGEAARGQQEHVLRDRRTHAAQEQQHEQADVGLRALQGEKDAEDEIEEHGRTS